MTAFLIANIGGCVTDVQKSSEKVTLTPSPDASKTVQVAKEVTVKLRSGYSRVYIKEHSIWKDAGAIAQGSVYRPLDTVMNVSAGDMHEGYMVVSNGAVVGVYLTAESAFVSSTSPESISLQEKNQ